MDTMLKTGRLILRPFTAADVDLLTDLDSDPAVLRWINGGTPTPRAVIEHRVLPRFLHLSSRDDGYGYWAAIERSSGQCIGWFSLYREENGDPGTAALGYRLRRSAWGKGYATEGANALICRGFSDLGMQRVVATTYEHNVGSRRVMEKAGMRLVRMYRSTPQELAAGQTSVFVPEEIWDGYDVDYALDRSEWQRQSDASSGGRW